MKRFHVHVSVDDLDANIRFYSTVFGTPPSVLKSDYAKWMLDDPRINFACPNEAPRQASTISASKSTRTKSWLALREQVGQAEIAALDQTGAACCYANSNKYWVTDPQGIAWETFHTLDSVPVFGEDNRSAPAAHEATACCTPATKPSRIPVEVAADRRCCG